MQPWTNKKARNMQARGHVKAEVNWIKGKTVAALKLPFTPWGFVEGGNFEYSNSNQVLEVKPWPCPNWDV